jgi:hypothetical protein
MRKLLPRGLNAFIVLLALAAADARGQGMRRYQPSRPTVSPYMNLFRGNVGPLPNYFSLVRPQINQQAVNQQVLSQQVQQSASINFLQSQAGQQTVTPTGKSSWFGTYGRQTFMSAPGGGAGGGRR